MSARLPISTLSMTRAMPAVGAKPTGGRHGAAFGRLISAIDGACAARRVELPQRLADALDSACAQPGLLDGNACAGHVDGYRRHMLYADPAARFCVMSLVWLPDQFSPVHGHRAWCSVAVLDGLLDERLYETLDDGRVRATASCRRARGSISFDAADCAAAPASQDPSDAPASGTAHRLGNGSAVPAVSLHIYGIAAALLPTHLNQVRTEHSE